MPGATWIGPTPNQRTDGMVEVCGLVLHIQQGTETGSEAWFKNPASQASSHFLNPKTGGLRQLVDTKDRAWAEAAGNAHWVSIENEGYAGDQLTPSQLENAAQLLAWLHTHDGVPLQPTDNPDGRGLGWHGMGGEAWGGHTGCPGEPIKAQRGAIIARARQILGLDHPPQPAHEPFPGVSFFTAGRRSPVIAAMHRRLVAEGCGRYQSNANSDVWGPGDVRSYAAWQRKLGYAGSAADGIPGPTSWAKLHVPNV
ncbi:peptidoglycan-binding protein [Streptomyces sp. NPDC007856]|uniref:peptidoglycan-binding protein n=1 Tax=Streptomyces sp. NPDC007856 TaxID=3364781 RepID=UPI0036B72EF4